MRKNPLECFFSEIQLREGDSTTFGVVTSAFRAKHAIGVLYARYCAHTSAFQYAYHGAARSFMPGIYDRHPSNQTDHEDHSMESRDNDHATSNVDERLDERVVQAPDVECMYALFCLAYCELKALVVQRHNHLHYYEMQTIIWACPLGFMVSEVYTLLVPSSNSSYGQINVVFLNQKL